MKIKTLKDTAELMCSEDYRDRFVAECKQLEIRYHGLKKMLDKWDRGELEFTPTCTRGIYVRQLMCMENYLSVLYDRAQIEEICVR